MSGHTPGPWFISRSCMGVHKYVEARIGGGMVQEVACCGPTEAHSQSDANARLIAAAPELLEALKLCAAVCAGDTMSKSGLINALEEARAAITKATGES